MKKEELIENLLSGFKMPEGKAESVIWENIQKKMNDDSKVVEMKPRSLTKRLLPFIAAASVVLAVLVLFPSSNQVAFKNLSNDLLVETLPDGSVVTLSPQSSVSFESDEEGRDVHMKGEAFFNVKKGNKFSVITENGVVEVLGTSFMVNSRVDLIDVRCYTGKVKVETQGTEVLLTKGLGTSSLNSGETFQHNNVLKLGEQGILKFDNQALNLVLEDLKIFKGLEIKNMSSKNPSISVEFGDEDNNRIIEVLAQITGLKEKKVGDTSFELY